MKKLKKLTALVLSLSMVCITMAGCGNANTNGNDGNVGGVAEAELPEYTYVPEYETLNIEDYFGEVIFDQDGFYYIKTEYDMETGIETADFCFYDFETKEITPLPLEIEEGEYVVRTIVQPDNKLLLVTQKSTYTEESSTTQFFLNEYNLESGEKTQVEITDDLGTNDDYLYIEYAAADSKGNVYMSGGDSKFWVFDSTFKLTANISIPSYITAMGVSKDDALIIGTYSDNGSYVLQKYNTDTNTFDTGEEIDFYLYSQNSMIPGIEKDFIVKTETGLRDYSLGDVESTEIVNFINSDINSDIVQNFTILKDGRIVLLTQDWETNSYELVYLTKTKTSELPVKQRISLKTIYLGYDLKGKIIEFNKSNTEYRVVVETYDTTDYEAAMTKYQTDLATGNASDIIDLGMSNINELATKGLLEDFYPYIDADEEFTREDFFQNVLDAYTVNEKLCAVIPSVYLITMIGKTKFVGEDQGWTPKEIVELSKSLPEDTKLIEYGSQKEILTMLVSYDLNYYINWETGECKFNSDEFISLMEFANGFPTQEEYMAMFEDTDFDYGMMDGQEKIASDKLILSQGYFSSLSDYQYTMSLFNEPAVCVGYPCVEGTGTFLGSSGTALGMNANSNKKEGAWEFIRYYLTEEAAINSWGLPVNKNAYNKMMEEAMQPEYFENDEDIYVPEDQQKIAADGRVEMPVNSIYIGDEVTYEYAPTQEVVDAFKEIYMSTSSLVSYNEKVMAIIAEEADGYFAGEKEAQAVADIIQSRLQIYINENR